MTQNEFLLYFSNGLQTTSSPFTKQQYIYFSSQEAFHLLLFTPSTLLHIPSNIYLFLLCNYKPTTFSLIPLDHNSFCGDTLTQAGGAARDFLLPRLYICMYCMRCANLS